VSVSGGSSRLITQLYFPGEPNNLSDPMGDMFERIIGRSRDPQTADVNEGYVFDIVVGGKNATFFE
jgi:protocatechuate 3,4-dioxygenase beta subunit